MTSDLSAIADVLARRGLEPRESGGRIRALCPVHEADGKRHRPSLSVFSRRDGGAGLVCWGGCPSRDVWRALGGAGVRSRGGSSRNRVMTSPDRVTPPLVGPWDDDSPVPGAFQPPQRDWPNGTIRAPHVATYRHVNRDGLLIGLVDRFHYFDAYGGRLDKTFRRRVPVKRNGSDLPPFRWARPKGLLFPLYGISTLYDRSEASPIYVVEGQRDVLTLHARGLHAVSAPDGARGWHDRHTSELLQALLPSDTVNIAGDTDPAGDRWRQTLCAALRAHAGPVTVLS